MARIVAANALNPALRMGRVPARVAVAHALNPPLRMARQRLHTPMQHRLHVLLRLCPFPVLLQTGPVHVGCLLLGVAIPALEAETVTVRVRGKEE